MAQEIELKFIVNHSAVEALRDHLNTLGVSLMLIFLKETMVRENTR